VIEFLPPLFYATWHELIDFERRAFEDLRLTSKRIDRLPSATHHDGGAGASVARLQSQVTRVCRWLDNWRLQLAERSALQLLVLAQHSDSPTPPPPSPSASSLDVADASGSDADADSHADADADAAQLPVYSSAACHRGFNLLLFRGFESLCVCAVQCGHDKARGVLPVAQRLFDTMWHRWGAGTPLGANINILPGSQGPPESSVDPYSSLGNMTSFFQQHATHPMQLAMTRSPMQILADASDPSSSSSSSSPALALALDLDTFDRVHWSSLTHPSWLPALSADPRPPVSWRLELLASLVLRALSSSNKPQQSARFTQLVTSSQQLLDVAGMQWTLPAQVNVSHARSALAHHGMPISLCTSS
jgi:hypothetical protein